MLDKFKQRKQRIEEVVQEFEAGHDNVRKVRTHVSRHRGKYGAVVGVGATVLVMKHGGMTGSNMEQVINNAPKNSGVLYKSTQIINNTVEQTMVRQGEPGRKTYWVEKGVWFPSRGAAAKAADVSTASVSKVCNGVVESVKGQHFFDGGDMV